MSNEWRVEPRNLLVGTGMGVTPERLQDIESQRVKSERLNRPAPERPFKEVLAQTIERIAKENEPGEEDPLPQKPSKGGGLLSAYQREILGLDDDEQQASGAKVLFKG